MFFLENFTSIQHSTHKKRNESGSRFDCQIVISWKGYSGKIFTLLGSPKHPDIFELVSCYSF